MTTRSRHLINNFNAGEISPLMSGRVDYPRYQSGVESCENMILHVQGGASRRWGTRFIAEVNNSARKTRLLPLEFADDNYLIAEMGHEYMNFYKESGIVYTDAVEEITNGTFDSGITGWTVLHVGTHKDAIWDSTRQALKLNSILGWVSDASQAVAGLSIGDTYQLTCTTSHTASSVFIGTSQYDGTGITGKEIGRWRLSPGSNVIYFVATATTHYFNFHSAFWPHYIDNVSLRNITGGTAVSITTPYQEEDVFEVQYVQANDVIYFTHQKYPVYKLSRLAEDNSSWTFIPVNFAPPPTQEQERALNTKWNLETVAVGAGIKLKTETTWWLNGSVDDVITWPGNPGRAVITTYTSGTEVLVDIIEAFPASLIDAGLGTLTGATTAITVSVPHGLTDPANIGDLIVLTSGTYSGESRRITAIPDTTHLTIDAAFTGDPGGATYNVSHFIPSGQAEFIGSPSAKLTSDKVGPVNAIVTLTLDAAGWRSEDATTGKYVKAMGGLVKLTEITSSTVIKGQLLVPFSKAPTTAPFETLSGTWTVEDPAWSATNLYPAACTFYEQRLFFGGSKKSPQTIWGSATNDYENFFAGSLADEGVEYTIASTQLAPIHWLASARVLLIGTSSREYRASGGTDPISPTNIEIRAETSFGSPKRRPLTIGHTVIFIQRAGRRIRELEYSYESDAYKANDLTVIAPHVTGDGVNEIVFCPEPYSQLFMVRQDGQLLVLSWNKEQEVFGWSRYITDGDFESVACLPPPTGSDQWQVYVVVKRTIDGATVRYIERFDSTVYTDCAATGADPITTVTGLDHLEGETVHMKGDDALYPDGTVSVGTVTFPEEVQTWEVGLPYTSTIVTNRPEANTDKGGIQGLPKSWAYLYVRVIDTIGLKVNGEQVGTRDSYDLLGQVVEPETGDYRVDVLGIDGDAKLTIQQDLPFPATVVLIAGELVIGE